MRTPETAGRVTAQPVLATEMRSRNDTAPLFVRSSSGVLSPPEVNLTKGLKTPMCGQRFSDSGGSLEVHLRHHPITPGLCRGNYLGPRAPPPFQDLCRVRPEQTFAKARGCSNPGRGPGAPARLAEPPSASAAPQEGWGASNSCLLKLPGATWLPHREGREARENWLA